MATRGLRGSTLEELINMTNEVYESHHLCLIQKVPTPITPVEFDKVTRRITLAYFEKKSTVDYIGLVQGIPVCFDAKECASDTFALSNVHEHQLNFMREFERQGGVAFIIIYYTQKDRLYYLTLKKLLAFWEREMSGGRKSFRLDELDDEYFLSPHSGLFVPYLDAMKKDLDSRDK